MTQSKKVIIPACNHYYADEHNIGYVDSIMTDGTNYEAELWTYDEIVGLTVVIPEKNDFYSEDAVRAHKKAKEQKDKLIGFSNEQQFISYGILCVGMVSDGEEESLEIIQRYVDYLCEMRIVSFTSNYYNGSVIYNVDENGNELAEIIITLKEDDLEYAETCLEFKSFPGIRRCKLC